VNFQPLCNKKDIDCGWSPCQFIWTWGKCTDLHILYAIKQNKNHYPPDTFSGLKIAAKYVCGAGGAYNASSGPLAALGRGREGRGVKDRKGRRGGQVTRKGRGEEGKEWPPLFGSTLRPCHKQQLEEYSVLVF